MQQAGGKARQLNATGGKNASLDKMKSLHKINWWSGIDMVESRWCRVESRWCSCVANPFERGS